MKKLIFVLLFTGSVYAANDIPLNIVDFKGGIRNDIDNTRIADNEVEDAQNVLFDTDSTAKKRNGMVKLNSTALGSSDNRNIYNQFEYRKSNGNSYHIVHASSTLYYRISGSEFTSFHAGISSTTPMNFAVFMDTLNYCNGEIGINAWDANTSTFTQTTTYKPKYIISWQNRLCIAGDPAEPSNVRFSGFQNPKDWTTGVNLSSSPCVFSINSQDGQKITGFALSPNGNLMILKEKSVWEIGGYDKSDFYQRLVIQDVGCVDQGSITYKKGSVYWLSSEGWASYNGSNYSIVSDNIIKTIKEIQQLNVGSGMILKNTKPTWDIYYSTYNIQTNIDNGLEFYNLVYTTTPEISKFNEYIDLVKSGTTYYIYHDNTSPQFLTYNDSISSWTYHNIPETEDIITCLSQNNLILNNNQIGFSYFTTSSSSDNLKYAKSVIPTVSISTKTIAQNLATPTSTLISVNRFSSCGYDINKTTWVAYNYLNDPYWDIRCSSYTVTGDTWSVNSVAMTRIGSTIKEHPISGAMVMNGNVMNIVQSKVIETNDTTNKYYHGIWFSSFTVGGSFTQTNSTITYISESSPFHDYDPYTIDIATNSLGTIYVTYISSSNDIILSSNSGTGWLSETVYAGGPFALTGGLVRLFVDNNNAIYIDYVQFIGSYSVHKHWLLTKIYGGSWNKTNIQSGNNTICSSNINIGDSNRLICANILMDDSDNTFINLIKESTGYYITDIYNTYSATSTITSFTIDSHLNNINVSHYIRSGISTSSILTENYTQISTITLPAVGLAQYVQYKIIFDTNIITDFDDLSYLNNLKINYKSATGGLRLSSMYYDNRLWNGVSISSGNVLDTTLVLDRNNSWTKFKSNINPLSYLNLNGIPYLGANDGYIYQLDTSNDDSGQPIESYILTKAYDMGSIITEKSMDNSYLVALEAGSWNLSLDYYLNKALSPTETIAIDLSANNIVNYKLPIKTHPRFYSIQFKLYNTNSNEPFDFMGLYSILRSYPLR